MMGVVRQGFQCAKCNINVHKNCRLQAEIAVPICEQSSENRNSVLPPPNNRYSDSNHRMHSSASHVLDTKQERESEGDIHSDGKCNRSYSRDGQEGGVACRGALSDVAPEDFQAGAHTAHEHSLHIVESAGGVNDVEAAQVSLSEDATRTNIASGFNVKPSQLTGAKSSFTFPNGSPVPHLQEMESELSKEGGQTGTLHLRVTAAHVCTDRCRETWHERSHGTIGPDCYIKVDFEGIQLISQTIYKTSNPKFNEDVRLKVGSPRSFLTISIHRLDVHACHGPFHSSS